jgi:hypothetical protein
MEVIVRLSMILSNDERAVEAGQKFDYAVLFFILHERAAGDREMTYRLYF